MENELNSFTMSVRPVIFCGQYLNVPGNNVQEYNYSLINAIELIGQKFGTVNGSNLKKGVHYIQKELGCSSKRQIKMMMRNEPNALMYKSDDTKFVYRCHRETFNKVFEYVVGKGNIKKGNGELFSDVLIKKAKVGIRYVLKEGKNDILKSIALDMINNVVKVDNLYEK